MTISVTQYRLTARNPAIRVVVREWLNPQRKALGCVSCPLAPKYVPKLVYCNGAVAGGQGFVRAAVEYRTTASSNEQKDRTPVWLAVTGFETTL